MSAPLLSDWVKSKFPDAVIAAHQYRGDDTVTVRPEWIVRVAQALRDDPATQMNLLMDLSAVDYSTFGRSPQATGGHVNAGIALQQPMNIPDQQPWPGTATQARFEVVYHFASIPLKHRLRVKVPVEESKPEIDTVTTLWGGADWFEREIWDMFGIKFTGHPNLKRILMYEGFEGHPLRKDYPVTQRQPLVGPMN